MVSDSADFGTIVLEIIKCGANLVSEFFMIFLKIFKPNYLRVISQSFQTASPAGTEELRIRKFIIARGALADLVR